jgi:FkbM family methyltransferase
VRLRRNDCRCQFVAVEAEPVHFRWIRDHFRDNDIDPNAHELIWAAVGGQPGFVPFWVGAPEGWYGQAIAVGQPPPLPDVGSRRRLKARSALGRPPVPANGDRFVTWIPCVTLADVLGPYPRVDLIDLDVQGAEYEVLASAIDLVNKRVRRLHIGTHSAEIEQQLRDLLSTNDWQKINDYPAQSTTETPYGMIQFGDGVQTWVNSAIPADVAVPGRRKARPAPRNDYGKLVHRLRTRLERLQQRNLVLKRENAELRERTLARDAQVRALRQSRSWRLWFARWLMWRRPRS